MRSIDLSLFADYFQFYLQDEGATGDLSDAWNKETVSRLLAVAPGTIGVATVRNARVPVRVEIHESEPDNNCLEWDHVVEASLNVASGRIVVAGCTEYFPEAKRIEIAPGTYRARVSYGGFDTLSKDGLSASDHYRVQLWLAPSIAARVLKQWSK